MPVFMRALMRHVLSMCAFVHVYTFMCINAHAPGRLTFGVWFTVAEVLCTFVWGGSVLRLLRSGLVALEGLVPECRLVMM